MGTPNGGVRLCRNPSWSSRSAKSCAASGCHRKRIVTPFAHVTDSPLVDVLFSITRGALPAPKRPISPPPDAPPDEPLVPKGMVNYRRERRAAPDGEYGDR
jgi:hypothetical protein